ncbi:hypothetical protein ALE3EI_0144 [Constantimarinum furrinae]|uniref:HTH araC/xylS-type domain-containing protein n=2 Tax=Constantimarinum furrinae TaxID=2562285 RepID=A0A7G8PQW9_9FLAO|nr:hypothetical protein ALE3EI_0144 [Constantimarinum furrinae]
MVLSISNVSSQTKQQDFQEMMLEAQKIVFSEPQEAVKIADHLIQNSASPQQSVAAYKILGRAYYVQGNFNNAVLAGMKAKDIAERIEDPELQMEVVWFTLPILMQLQLDMVAQKYYENVLAIQNSGSNLTRHTRQRAGTTIFQNLKRIEEGNLNELDFLSEAISAFESSGDWLIAADLEAILLNKYTNSATYEAGSNYLHSFLNNNNNNNDTYRGDYHRMIALFRLGEIHFKNKAYDKAIQPLASALDLSEKLSNSYFRAQISEVLALTYLPTQDLKSFYMYKEIGTSLENEVTQDEKEAVNSIYNYINQNHVRREEQAIGYYRQTFLILGGIFILVLMIWAGLRWRYRRRIAQYAEFIKYFKNRESEKTEKKIIQKVSAKSAVVPKETEEALIKKLDQFERSVQFTKNEMSLAMLAAQFETNTKYLSEVINSNKNKNFNTYINELRIDYIIDKLRHQPTYLNYKISYLAEESGFNSHSSFATVFKSVTGISPTVFIDILKSNTEKEQPKKKAYETL